MLEELNCKPSWNNIFEWAHWITPESEKFRYDTYFYLIPIDKARQLNAEHDCIVSIIFYDSFFIY